jgi:predicted phage terminase large subunit-like protein
MNAALDMSMDPRALLAECDRAEVAEGGLAAFAKLAWPIVQGEVVWSWHMDLVCAHLEAVSRGECKRLVINIPPGHSKSMLVSVLWPAWDWIKRPKRKWMFTSFDSTLSLRDAGYSKELIQSEWYQERWGEYADPEALKRYGLEPVIVGAETISYSDSNPSRRKKKSARTDAASQFYTRQNGLRFSTFFGGKATGWHADIQVCDDPTKPRDIQEGGEKARKALQRTRATWKGTYSSRKANAVEFARVVIMQRLHDADLAADCIADGYTHVCLPTEYDPDRHCATPWGEDPRTEEGELLCPERFPREVVDEIKSKDMSAMDYAAQHDQNPLPEGGSLFQLSWFKQRWTVLPAGIRLIMSVDATFKDSVGSDFVCVQVWGVKGAQYYLIDQRCERMDISGTMQTIVDMRRKWPRIGQVLIEDKANGSAIMTLLRTKVPGMIAVEPEGGKFARASRAEPFIRAGNVILPEDAEWVSDFTTQMTRFPMAAHDDMVDCCSQALNWLTGKNPSQRLADAMKNVREGRLG